MLRRTAALLACSLFLCASASAQDAPPTSAQLDPIPEASSSTSSAGPVLRINREANVPALQDFLIAPTRTVIAMNPGETRVIDVQVLNRSSGLTTYRFSTEDFIADPENDGLPSFFTDNTDGPFPARKWITPEVPTVTLQQGDRLFLRLTITVPSDAEPGDHQAALIATRVDPNPGKAGFALVSRVASLFIVSVPGDVVKKGDAVSLSAERWFNWWLPARLRLTFRNEGTVYMEPQGTVQIRNIFGILVDEIALKDWIVLRGSTRSHPMNWQPTFALGRYTAVSQLTAFDGEQLLTPVRAAFWVVPLLPVLLALLAIFAVSFFVQYFFSRFELRRKDEPEERK